MQTEINEAISQGPSDPTLDVTTGDLETELERILAADEEEERDKLPAGFSSLKLSDTGKTAVCKVMMVPYGMIITVLFTADKDEWSDWKVRSAFNVRGISRTEKMCFFLTCVLLARGNAHMEIQHYISTISTFPRVETRTWKTALGAHRKVLSMWFRA